MDVVELKKEQLKLAAKVLIRDTVDRVKFIGGAATIASQSKLWGCVVVCEFPSLKLVEQRTYLLHDPLPYHPGFEAYREMPALVEAYNSLEQEPDILLVEGAGILHPRRLGLASHVGLALNQPTIGVMDSLPLGRVEKGKIFVDNEIVGFEIKTREYSKPIYASPGHLVSLGMVLHIIPQTVMHPHKMPEPIHLAHKIAKKKLKGNV